MAGAAYLAVARIRKPHGLKGEVVAWLHTDDPEAALAIGRVLVPIDEGGNAVGEGVTVERSRRYQRQWLLKFEGIDDREGVDGWRERLLGAPAEDLRPPTDGELYEHEMPGAAVTVEGKRVGTVVDVMDAPGGRLLAIEIDGREVLVPFRQPIVRAVHRARREVVLDPPDGLLEL